MGRERGSSEDDWSSQYNGGWFCRFAKDVQVMERYGSSGAKWRKIGAGAGACWIGLGVKFQK
jgi:hypothetical protein